MNIKNNEEVSIEPALYVAHFVVDETKDTFISFGGWGKGIAFVNAFNIGRLWPSTEPQCNALRHDENNLVIFELESPNSELVVHSVDHPNFTCRSGSSSLL